MKTLRQLCVASALTLALAVTASAGEISTTVASPQPAPAVTADGDLETGLTRQVETGSGEATDSVAEIALNLLQSVLSLF